MIVGKKMGGQAPLSQVMRALDCPHLILQLVN